jgi:uncharacterized paraquat-inducible protein A
LRRTSSHRRDHLIALAVTAFILLVIMCSTRLMGVEGRHRAWRKLVFHSGGSVRHRAGSVRQADRHPLCADPAARRRAAPPFARVFVFAEKLRPWSMIDVFVFGVFVAYVKLGDLVTIGLAAGVYALLGLTFVLCLDGFRAQPRGGMGEAGLPKRE